MDEFSLQPIALKSELQIIKLGKKFKKLQHIVQTLKNYWGQIDLSSPF